MPSRPNNHPGGFFLNAVLMLSFLVGAGLDSFSVTYGSSYHEQKQQQYPLCRRDKRPEDLGIFSFLHDGNLSQHHAYLSCVWFSRGSNTPYIDFERYSFYNSMCADMYKCVAVKFYHNGVASDSLVNPTTHLFVEQGDINCGVNIMELILIRRKARANTGTFEYLMDFCALSRAAGTNPIETMCAGVTARMREMVDRPGYKASFTPAPNPCLKENEAFYSKYLF